MAKFQDLTGRQFGALTVIEKAKSRRQKCGKLTTYWKCQCKCGRIIEVRKDGLTINHTCIHNRIPKCNKRLYFIYKHMKERCYCENNSQYKNYGGRGIKICDEWLDNEKGFMNFNEWALKNGYNPNAKFHECTIDRIDVNGNYEPDNCRWVSNYFQARNKRNNIYINHNNQNKILADWAKQYNIAPNVFRYRYLAGWDFNKIINTPIKKRGDKNKKHYT